MIFTLREEKQVSLGNVSDTPTKMKHRFILWKMLFRLCSIKPETLFYFSQNTAGIFFSLCEIIPTLIVTLMIVRELNVTSVIVVELSNSNHKLHRLSNFYFSLCPLLIPTIPDLE